MSFSPSAELSRDIYMFFIMSTLDEKLSIQNTQKVISALKTKAQSEKALDEKWIRKFVLWQSIELWQHFSNQILAQRQKTALNKNDKASPAMTWANQLIGVQPQMMSIWNKFSRQARPEESLALLVIKVLNFGEEDLSEALGVSVGTIRFRLARAAKQLGVCVGEQT